MASAEQKQLNKWCYPIIDEWTERLWELEMKSANDWSDEKIQEKLRLLAEQKNAEIKIAPGSILNTVKLGSKDTGKHSGTKKKKSKKDEVQEGQPH